MWFQKNKEKQFLTSYEFESLSKKFIELYSEVENLKIKIKILETNTDNLRGNFNTKLRRIKKEELEEEPTDPKETINNPVILPYGGI